MIARKSPLVQPESWKKQLANAYTNPLDLLRALEISPTRVALDPTPQFAFRVPRGFAAKMAVGDVLDPLLLQVLPLLKESEPHQHFVADPVNDQAFQRTPGLLHKYRDRALVIAAGSCAVNCRYCFRRNYPYQHAIGKNKVDSIISTLHSDININEVILSGGDPLILDDENLDAMIGRLAEIPHLQRLRVHTRLPVTIPERLTTGLINALRVDRFDIAFVLHINHANEIDVPFSEKIKMLHQSGINVLNQSVLLKGINDDPAILAELSKRLFTTNILPYYLHLLDPVAGSAHFDVPLARAKVIEQTLREQLAGYLVPKFVREIPHQSAKTPLAYL